MKDGNTIGLRCFSRELNEREMNFYGISGLSDFNVVWPDKCVNCLKPAKKKRPLTSSINRDYVMMEVPLCAEHYLQREKRYSWVSGAAIWISYTGVILLFLVLYFAFSFTGKGSFPPVLLWSVGIVAVIIAFMGILFPQAMRLLWPAFRRWDDVPAVKMKLVRSNPYFKDLIFSFGSEEFCEEFRSLNSRFDMEHHLQICNEKLLIQKRLLEREDKNAEATFMYGLTQERCGDFKGAIESFHKALEIRASYPRASRHLGACYLIESQPGQAEEALENALKLEPDNSDTLLLLSALYQNLKKFPEAEALLARCIDTNPGDPELHCRLAEFYFSSKQFSKAESEFGRALLLQDDHVQSMGGLALLYLETGETLKFTVTVTKLRKIDPELAGHLAQIVAKMV